MWSDNDLQPISIGGDTIESVPEFRYLGSIVEAHGEILKEVEDRIARASRAFGTLCRPVFQDNKLSLETKRMVYRAVVMGVLLYGAEAWENRRIVTKKLESFNNKCLRRIYPWHSQGPTAHWSNHADVCACGCACVCALACSI